ncbi:hypothetical protein BACCELL_00273 [Bacteroides cellulosilyticus DSM 14838]|uniref:Uncharacterized protein n=1 Tax=Bacteroides cellulosilyticus DSM 14838 TaxID=537012 RepID=E2N7M9_9BACE|nr:hypothetical protein BACCELL_00273 [Bacteroides cellulosilyticus DSM 14838]
MDVSQAEAGIHVPVSAEAEAVSGCNSGEEGFALGATAEEGVVELSAADCEADVGAAEAPSRGLQPVSQLAADAPSGGGVGAVAVVPHTVGGVGGEAPAVCEVEFGSQVGGEGGPGEQIGAQRPAGMRGGAVLRFLVFLSSHGLGAEEGQCQEHCG